MTGSAIVTHDPAELSGGALEFSLLIQACSAEALALNACGRIWVALSGGADSTALLHAVVNAKLTPPISVTHIDHGIQSEAEYWANHCTQLCEQLGVPIDVHRVTPPADGHFTGGFEAWARTERYAYWGELLKANEVLLCAHHADDQAETVALRLLQGRLPLPIPARRRLRSGSAQLSQSASGNPLLLRPLLDLRRAQLRGALVASGHHWIEDPSNKDTRLLRNQVRAVLPKLAQLQGAAKHENGSGWFNALKRCGALVDRLQGALRSNLGVTQQGADPTAAGELARVSLTALRGAVALQGVLALFGSGPVSRKQAHDALARLRKQAAAGKGSGAARGGVSVGIGSNNGGSNARRKGRLKGISGRDDHNGDATVSSVQAVVAAEFDPAGLAPKKEQGQPPELRLFADASDIVIWREPQFAPTPLEAHGRQALILPHGTLVVEFGDSAPADLGEADGAAIVVRPLTAADRLLYKGRMRRVKELLRASGVPRWARGSYPVVVAVAAGAPLLAVPVPLSGSLSGSTGWLRDGAAPQVPVRASWRANLPS